MPSAPGIALITGVTGQDGTYLAERLVAEGWAVHGIGLGTSPYLPAEVVLHRVDLRDSVGVRRVVDQVAPAEIYHLGGLSSIAACWADPVACAEINGSSAATILAAAHALQERSSHRVSVVLASSAAIFGDPQTAPQDESTPVAPISPYGAAKAYAHQLCAIYRAVGLHAVSAILYNHESPRRPRQFVARKITSTVAAIARGESTRLVLGNVAAVRDWGWAPDHVDAMIRAARHSHADDYVIATGEGYSVHEFAATAFALAGIDNWQQFFQIDATLSPSVDAQVLVGDPSKAQREFGWQPSKKFPEIVGAMLAADLSSSSDA